MPNLEPPSLVGQTLDGRYKITRKLGEGGMGEVYAAEHVHIEKRYAIKLLRPEIVSNPEAVQRFRQEARSSSSIGHPNIIAIEDFGTLSDGRIYMAMELLNGAALNDLITTPQPVDRLLNIMIQTGHGLAAAHAKNIVHRDMKPENIFVTIGRNNEDVPKLLDFGIAKVAGNDGQNNLTRTGTIFGTPFYMAPEQALGNPVDARTDIYAVGVIMYEIFAGSLPFQGESFMGILTQHITTEPEPVAQRAAKAGRQLPMGLPEIITRCMAKNPAQRFATMDELVNLLVEIYRGIAGAGMSTYMQAFPQPSPTSGRMAVPTPGPMQIGGGVAPTVGVGQPNVTPTGMPQVRPHSPTGPTSQPNVIAQQSGGYPPQTGPGVAYDPNASAPMHPPVKKSKTGLIIALIVILLAIGGGVAAFIIVSQNGGKDGPSSGSGSGSAAPGSGSEHVALNDKDAAVEHPTSIDAGGVTHVEIDAAVATVDIDAAVTPPPLTPDAPVIANGVQVLLTVKNAGVFEVYEDGNKIMDGPDMLTVAPDKPRTVTIKVHGFKDKVVTVDGKTKKLELKLDRVPIVPTGCTATSCGTGQICEKGKCVLAPKPAGCTATSCPLGEFCENGTCKRQGGNPTTVDCTSEIKQPRNIKCVKQFCKAHPDDLKCQIEP
jgi:serine/threonine-protein kinase